jgi:ribosomal protein S27AE
MLTIQNDRWKNKETIMAKIREVWAASLDSCKCGQQVVWAASLDSYKCGQQVVWAASLDSYKCGQQVWTAVLSIDSW